MGCRQWGLPLSRFDARFNATARLTGTLHIENVVFLARQLVVIDEELFQFLHELLAQVADVLDVGVAVVFFLDADDPIVALAFLFLPLFAFYHPDHAALHKHAGKSRLVHQH